MAVEFKQAPFNDPKAFSNQCLIGGIEQRDDGKGNTPWCWSLGTLPPKPRWQVTAYEALDLESAKEASRKSFAEWLECAGLSEKAP